LLQFIRSIVAIRSQAQHHCHRSAGLAVSTPFAK
jgi:hypothetical protein